MSIKMRGLPGVRVKLQAYAEAQKKAARREVMRSVLNIQAGAKRRARVDTGRLRNSIAFEVAPDGLSARIGTNVEYAPHQEFGTRRMPAAPFLFPALEEERPEFLRRLGRSAGRVQP